MFPDRGVEQAWIDRRPPGESIGAREGLSRSLIRASVLSISSEELGALVNGFFILDLPVKLGGVGALVPRLTA